MIISGTIKFRRTITEIRSPLPLRRGLRCNGTERLIKDGLVEFTVVCPQISQWSQLSARKWVRQEAGIPAEHLHVLEAEECEARCAPVFRAFVLPADF